MKIGSRTLTDTHIESDRHRYQTYNTPVFALGIKNNKIQVTNTELKFVYFEQQVCIRRCPWQRRVSKRYRRAKDGRQAGQLLS